MRIHPGVRAPTHVDDVHLLFFFIICIIQRSQPLVLPRKDQTIGKQAKQDRLGQMHQRLALNDEAGAAQVECKARQDGRRRCVH